MKIYLFNTDGWANQEYLKRTGDLPDDAHIIPAGIIPALAFWNGSEVIAKTQAERDIYDAEQANAAKQARTIFTQLQIREAFKAINKESDLDTLLSDNQIFQTYWQEAQEIDLNHPVTVQAIANFTEAEINALKSEM
jgi:O6-methylguanine-DNA--protein-cysteine methyltransferase